MEINECCEVSEDDSNLFKVIDIDKLPSLVNFDNEIDVFDVRMASLNSLMLGQSYNQHVSYNVEQEDVPNRLSLAYEKLHSIPNIILEEISSCTRILDISNNKFSDISFLSEFKELTSLICDHNFINSRTVIPYMPKLELLWMNHCKIAELYPWAKKLQHSCPNLRYLSLMGNSAAPSYLNGGNFYEYLQYRLFIISLFPGLVHLDDRRVTEDQRDEALKMYEGPLWKRIVYKKTKFMPSYLRQATEKISDNFTITSNFLTPQKNSII